VSRLETGATDEDVKGHLMSEEDNTAIVGRWFTEFWGADFRAVLGSFDGRRLQERSDPMNSNAERISPRALNAPARLDAVARELDEYFERRRQRFDVLLDWQLSAGFRSTVLHQLPEIGYGHTASYSTMARLAGNPKAVRAVASACATNPLPVVVPRHRVVRADGGMGGYLGGIEAKQTLLTLEAAA